MLSYHQSIVFGSLILSVSVLSVVVSVCRVLVIRKKKHCSVLVMSLMIQIVSWDILRSMTIGLVAGSSYFTTTLPPQFCAVVGPLSHISHRVPFFLGTSLVLTSSSSTTRRSRGVTSIVVMAIGYVFSIVLSLLPFLRGNSYHPGMDGFCTYYSEDVLDLDYQTITERELLLYDILLSVLPFLATFLMVVLVTAGVAVFCGVKKELKKRWLPSTLSLLICYLPMTGIGLTLIGSYAGLPTFLTQENSSSLEYALTWIQMVSMVLMPVATPLLTAFITALMPNSSDKPINRKCSVSTTVLIHQSEDSSPS